MERRPPRFCAACGVRVPYQKHTSYVSEYQCGFLICGECMRTVRSLGDHLSSREIAAMLRVCIGRLDRLEAEAKKEVKNDGP